VSISAYNVSVQKSAKLLQKLVQQTPLRHYESPPGNKFKLRVPFIRKFSRWKLSLS